MATCSFTGDAGQLDRLWCAICADEGAELHGATACSAVDSKFVKYLGDAIAAQHLRDFFDERNRGDRRLAAIIEALFFATAGPEGFADGGGAGAVRGAASSFSAS